MNDTGDGKDIAKAVAIAALSALATGLVTWAVEALKDRYKAPSPTPPSDPPEGEE